ncbi:MAG: aldehyde ferredoxin oxidoreductase family protein [Candidatus Heimdallarchaeota archaeon]
MVGIRGKLLKVNLTTQEITTEPLPLEIVQKFSGGSGLGAYLYYQFIKNLEVIPEAFASENPLYFLTGVLTGLPAYCTSRSTFCSRSPLTNIWGESNVGGKIGPALKFAGFDGVVITGAATEPTILVIDDGKARLSPAKTYWGKGTYEVQKQLTKDFKEEKIEVAVIGLAGENLVKYACIMTGNGRTAGRTGLGAVMGSKNLKAIVIKGTNTTFDLPSDFKEVSKQGLEECRDGFSFELLQEFGTAGNVDVALEMYGDMPIKNWSQGTIENAGDLSGITMAETILVGKKACYRCPIACGREIEIPTGPYKLPRIDGPEYETCASFGTNLGITDLEVVAYANVRANDLGMDTISAGETIAVLFDLVEKGVIPKKVLPANCKCTFGDDSSLITLLEVIAKREGIGDVLAEGSKFLAEKYKQAELAAQVNGLEAPYHDPRAFSGMALMYVTSPRGACHLNGDAYLTQQGQYFPEIDVEGIPDDRFANEGIVKALTNLQSYRQVYNAIGICQFYNPTATTIAQLLSLAQAQKISPEELIILGDRLFALKRLINLKLGWNPRNERLPRVMLQKLTGPTDGHVPDVQYQLKEWYSYRNYDQETGRPNKEKLEELGLLEIL